MFRYTKKASDKLYGDGLEPINNTESMCAEARARGEYSTDKRWCPDVTTDGKPEFTADERIAEHANYCNDVLAGKHDDRLKNKDQLETLACVGLFKKYISRTSYSQDESMSYDLHFSRWHVRRGHYPKYSDYLDTERNMADELDAMKERFEKRCMKKI